MSGSPFMRRINNRDSGHAGRKAEGSISKRLGGSLQPGSGALAGAKGDIKLDSSGYSFLMENKTSMGESFSMKQGIMHKIYQEALETNRTPALAIQFVRPNGQSEKRDRWVCLPESIFNELFGK